MDYQHIPDHFKYLKAIRFGELVFGVVGNLTASIVIMCSKSMRTLTDFYLLSLTISDLLVLIFGVFLQTYYRVYIDENGNYHSYIHSRVAFFACMLILSTSVRASILTVTAFTVERYLAVCRPFSIQSIDKKSRIKKVLSAIWSVAALIALLENIGMSYYLYSHEKIKAVIPDLDFILLFAALIELIVCFVLPILLITVMYILIAIKLCRCSIERQNITSRSDRTNKKTLIMFAVIIVIIFISWIPQNFHLLTAYLHYSSRIPIWYVELISELTYPLFPVLNPIIYVLMSKKFRKAFKDLLLKSRKKLSDWISTFRDRQTAEVSLEMI